MTDTSSATGRQVRTAVVVLLAVAILGILGWLALRYAVRALFESIPDRYREVVEDPGGDFTKCTGLQWPTGATILSVDDDHGGFNGDGEFHLVFQADHAVLEKWLAGGPPWGQSEWKRGPIPHEIGFHCSFGTSGVSTMQIENGPVEYYGDTKIARLLGSGQVWYAANERGAGSIRWHNGDLLVIDLSNNQVWLSVWDF